MLTVAGHLNGQGPAYFIVSIGGTVIHLLWQYMTVNLDMPKSCWSKFFFFKIPFILVSYIDKEILFETANLDGLCGED
jgi:uncharacterized protein (DUF983 family)